MPKIAKKGWELFIQRGEQQNRKGEPTRTYSKYQVFIDGKPVPGLSGNLCEREGPGDNTEMGKKRHLRIAEGRYPLSTQFGKLYRSVGYKDGATHPMPGFLLLGTGERTAILVHPAHEPTLYISSIGCLNPTSSIADNEDMTFEDSRGRVIALLESLKAYDKTAFKAVGTNTKITDAVLVIDGEP